MPDQRFLRAVSRSISSSKDWRIATPIRVSQTVHGEKLGNRGGKLKITLVETGHDPEHGMIGTQTPFDWALLDAEVGDEVEYRARAYIQKMRIRK